MTDKSYRTYVGIFAVLVLLTTSTLITSHPALAATSPTGVVIPLYVDPGSDWNEVIQAKNAHPSVPIVAVINPNNGPGSSIDSSYVTGIQQLQSAGVIVLGYVHTSYGSRSTATLESEINSYNSWYHVNGIMFDEMANTAGLESYYSNLSSYVKSLGMTMTMGNPGTDTLPSYIGTVDNLCIYENPGLPTVSDLGSLALSLLYPKSDFSMIAIGVGQPSQSYITSILNYVSYIYITDANLPNPYDALPSYFSSEVAMLDSGSAPPPTVPQPPTSLSATAISSSQINLSWSAPSNNGGSPITGYEIQRSTDGGTTWSTIVSNTGSAGTTYSNTGLTASTAYTYRVLGINSVGTSSPSNTASATTSSVTTTSAPQPPTGLTATEISSSQINLIWTSPSNNGGSAITGYEIDSSTNSGTTWSTIVSNTGSAGTTYSNTGLTASTAYTYRVSAINSVGTSQPSNTASATTSSVGNNTTVVSITVNSVNPSGTTFTGMWAELHASNGTILATGYTPVTFNVTSGVQYSVYVANYQNYVFSHWSNGSTNPSITITPTQNVALTAYYSTPATLTVKSVNLSGTTFTGMWTEIASGGTTVKTGYTTLHYAINAGNTYTVTVSNYQNYVFSHWSNGSTNPSITVTPTQNTTLVAYYKT